MGRVYSVLEVENGIPGADAILQLAERVAQTFAASPDQYDAFAPAEQVKAVVPIGSVALELLRARGDENIETERPFVTNRSDVDIGITFEPSSTDGDEGAQRAIAKEIATIQQETPIKIGAFVHPDDYFNQSAPRVKTLNGGVTYLFDEMFIRHVRDMQGASPYGYGEIITAERAAMPISLHLATEGTMAYLTRKHSIFDRALSVSDPTSETQALSYAAEWPRAMVRHFAGLLLGVPGTMAAIRNPQTALHWLVTHARLNDEQQTRLIELAQMDTTYSRILTETVEHPTSSALNRYAQWITAQARPSLIAARNSAASLMPLVRSIRQDAPHGHMLPGELDQPGRPKGRALFTV